MSILVWTLLSLSLFYSVVQEFYSFFVFFFKFSFDALILHILKSIHLKAILLLLKLSIYCFISSSNWWSLHHVGHVARCVLNHLVFLSFLSHLSEFYVTFIENNFLNVVSRHLSHKKTLGISIFVPLNYFIFKTDKLQNLGKHAWFSRAFLLQTFWHNRRHLRCKNFYRFRSISKLIKLSKYLTSFSLKFALQHLQSLIIVQLFLRHYPRWITKKCIDLVENIFSWSIASLKIRINTYFWKMTQHQNIVLL